MHSVDDSELWQCSLNEAFVPLRFEDEVVGFCKRDVAHHIIATLNADDRLQKALALACYDLVSLSGGGGHQVEVLMAKYLARTGEPKSGTAAIAALLRDRQDELDVTEREFIRFCDSYRLSHRHMQQIFAGQEIESNMLIPLSRVLGRSVEDLIQIMEGTLHT